MKKIVLVCMTLTIIITGFLSMFSHEAKAQSTIEGENKSKQGTTISFTKYKEHFLMERREPIGRVIGSGKLYEGNYNFNQLLNGYGSIDSFGNVHTVYSKFIDTEGNLIFHIGFNNTGYPLFITEKNSSSKLIFEEYTESNIDSDTFIDFEKDQYWSNDMLWSLNKGLINGYKDDNGNNLLKPYDTLTEAQALTILYRYTKPESFQAILDNEVRKKNDFHKISNQPPVELEDLDLHWAHAQYVLAEADELDTLGPDTNITRGKFAQFLAQIHFVYQNLITIVDITEKDAIQFMYDANISSGYSDEAGNTPKTYESFGPDKILNRAEAVTFMKRYADYLKNHSMNPAEPLIVRGAWGVETLHHGNDYGMSDQDKYDETMEVVNDIIEKYKGTITLGGEDHQYFVDYFNGERWDGDRSNRSQRNRALYKAEVLIGDLVKEGLSLTEIEKAMEAAQIAYKAVGSTMGQANETDHDTNAYKALVLKEPDNYSNAQAISAILNGLGFETKLNVPTGYANPPTTVYMKVGKSWFQVHNGSLKAEN